VTTPTVIETRRAGQTNSRIELAHYTVSDGERVISASLASCASSTSPQTATVVASSSSASSPS
jgi:hypothetical protein